MIGMRVFGGIGDALICSAAATRQPVTMFVQDWQVKLLGQVEGVVAQSIRIRPRGYDPFWRMDWLFADEIGMKPVDYYELVEKRLGFSVDLPKFKFPESPKDNSFYLHCSASEANREWVPENWVQIARSLRDAGYIVKFLGTEYDFGFEEHNIIRLCHQSKSLVWQAQQMTSGSFLGIDSGFCHIAGILGIPGYVIFTNTHPDHVIARYKLTPIMPDNFEPTRICGKPCQQSLEYARAITPELVAGHLGIPLNNGKNDATILTEIGIINNRGDIGQFLPGIRLVDGERPITLVCDSLGILIITPNKTERFIGPLRNLRRALMELTACA